jgi:electron transport complex protein RnfG
MKNNDLLDAWLVLVLAAVFGAALAGVYIALTPRILQNQRGDAEKQIPALVPGAARAEKTDVGGETVYRATDAAGALVGWAVPARGQGYADVIQVLIGVDAAADRITGLYVLDQKETPGLGDFIKDGEKYLNQFAGKPAGVPLTVVKKDASAANEIRAVTGATVSSRSVVEIVNAALERFRRHRAAAGA